MADKKENSRADELFDILNKLHGESADSDTPSAEGAGEENDTATHVDEILRILNSDSAKPGSSADMPSEQPQQTPASDCGGEELPTAIFSHLSDEGDADAAPQNESTLHFTDAGDSDIPEPQPEIEEEEDDEEEEEDTKIKKVGRFFSNMSFIPKAVLYIAVVVIAAAYLSYYIITIGNDVFALVSDDREVVVTLEEGTDDEAVAKLLKDNGIIEYDWVYKIYMQYRSDGDESTEYIAGEHTLNLNYNYSQIITALTRGNSSREIVRVTIPEGFTVNQIIDLLVSKGVGQKADYVEAINNYPYKWEFVKMLDEQGYSQDRIYRLEGYLYPDTYDFYTDENEVYIVNKMLGAFNEKFWKDFTAENSKGQSYQKTMLEKYGMSFDDIIVLASMVQSEGGTAEDFYFISHVFHNRLLNPTSFPKLESDATIQYVLPERINDSTQLDPSYETPYNTYLYNGLPPGAICNPGLDALSATLFPSAPTDEYGNTINAYFFVSNNAGKTYYASSKAGHENNVARVKRENEAIEAGTYEG